MFPRGLVFVHFPAFYLSRRQVLFYTIPARSQVLLELRDFNPRKLALVFLSEDLWNCFMFLPLKLSEKERLSYLLLDGMGRGWEGKGKAHRAGHFTCIISLNENKAQFIHDMSAEKSSSSELAIFTCLSFVLLASSICMLPWL